MRNFLVVVAAAVCLLILGLSGKLHSTSSKLVGDVSWPNCTLNLPKANAAVVGLNYGRVFTLNPCLLKETNNYRFLSLYLNTAYPGISYGRKYQSTPRNCNSNDNKCLAYNYGFAAGRYDASVAIKNNIYARQWWLDVETVNSWDTNPKANQAALEGMLAALTPLAGSVNLGIYSANAQWATLTGSWHNHLPVWLATGGTKQVTAVAACRSATSFTRGPIVLTQFTPSLDQNYLCKS